MKLSKLLRQSIPFYIKSINGCLVDSHTVIDAVEVPDQHKILNPSTTDYCYEYEMVEVEGSIEYIYLNPSAAIHFNELNGTVEVLDVYNNKCLLVLVREFQLTSQIFENIMCEK